MLQFKQDTKVHPLHSRGADIPTILFDFCPFDDLPQKAIDSKPLLDIIGVICDVGPYDYASATSQHKLRKLKIRNLEEQTQELVLWGQHGESFDEETVLKNSQEGIVIAIFAGMIQGSSSSVTQIYLDLDIPEVQKYRNSYQWKCPTLQKHVPRVKQLSPLEATGKLYTIEEICNLPASSFQGGVTFSTITKVALIIPSVKWYYKACKRCGKGYNNMTDTPNMWLSISSSMPNVLYIFLKSNTYTISFLLIISLTTIPCFRYKLPLTITDNSESLDAIAFSKVAEDLVERHADHVSMSMKIDAKDHVLALDNVIRKERLFYIGMNTDSSAKYPINYVLKKSFPVNNTKSTHMLDARKSTDDTNLLARQTKLVLPAQSPTIHANNENTPTTHQTVSTTMKESESRIKAKRRIDFTVGDADTSNSPKEPEESTTKKHKQENADTLLENQKQHDEAE